MKNDAAASPENERPAAKPGNLMVWKERFT